MCPIDPRFPLSLIALLLAACGGGSSSNSGNSNATSEPGTLLSAPQLVTTVTTAELLAQLSTGTNQQLLSLVSAPICDIAVYHYEYTTVGGAGEATTASGALMVPTGSGASCIGGRPIVLYAHATQTDRTFNIADLSNAQNAEGLFLATFFASQGYIVVASNYAGYDTSTLPYHPFLNAAQQSTDMIDALSAARSALPVSGAATTTDGGRLFITGYSQGGHVAMATHRAMQAAGMTVTASAPMSGPYAMAAFVDAVFEGEVDNGAPVLATLLFSSYQHSYGDIWANPTDVFEPPYATNIDSLLPSTMSRSELYASGELPQYALFSSTPPTPAYAAMTPATMPANLAPVFATGFGAGDLITNSYRLSYIQDAQSNPDGGWPTITTGVAAAAPGLAMRQALKSNDLRDWMPTAPILLCGGDEDPEVYWFNAQLMQNYWTAVAPSASATVLDLEAAPADPYVSVQQQFQAAKVVLAASAVVQGATDGGASAVSAAYHSTLVPPFCLGAVKAFFDAQ
jgi:hypothetical protein